MILKNRPLTFTYSSSALYEATFKDWPSFFIPVMETETYDIINKNALLSIVDKFVNNELLSDYSNPLNVSYERAIEFFGLNNENFFKLID